MRFILTFLAYIGLSFQAHAQQPTDAVIEAGKAIFSEVERQVIRDVMGRVGLPTTSSREQQENADREVMDGDDKKGKKGKKAKKSKKHKGKGKGKNKGMPPGLAKKNQLPPGLAKRDTLPAGLAKRNLPQEATSQLPPPPAGTERVVIDNDVLLVETGTQVVLDIIKDVILKP